MLRHHGAGELQHLFRRGGIQGGGVLVQQQQLGGDQGGHQQGEGLPLSAGQQPHRLAHPVLQPHAQQLQPLGEELLVLSADAAQGGGALRRAEVGQSQVLLDGEGGGGAPEGVLEQPPDDPAAPVVGHESHVPAPQGDGAGVHGEAARHGVEQGGFPRPVGANDGGEVAGGQMEGEAVQGRLFVDGAGIEGLGDVVHPQHISVPPSGPRPASAFAGPRPLSGWGRRWPGPPRRR